MALRNEFLQCTVKEHSSGDDILVCLNTMGDRHRYFVWDNQIAMCEYHMCLVMKDRKDGGHDTLVCSGAILRFDADAYYFNPVTPFGLEFSNMLPLPRSAVDYFAVQYQYYFQDDVRSKFSEDIVSVNCTNNLRTCLTFTNTTLCFGNVEDTTIIHSTQALVHGIIVAFAVGSLCYLFLRQKVSDYPLSFVFAFYIIPLVGIGMIYNGLLLTMYIPFIMGNFIVLFIFIMLYYPLRDFNEYYTKNESSPLF